MPGWRAAVWGNPWAGKEEDALAQGTGGWAGSSWVLLAGFRQRDRVPLSPRHWEPLLQNKGMTAMLGLVTQPRGRQRAQRGRSEAHLWAGVGGGWHGWPGPERVITQPKAHSVTQARCPDPAALCEPLLLEAPHLVVGGGGARQQRGWGRWGLRHAREKSCLSLATRTVFCQTPDTFQADWPWFSWAGPCGAHGETEAQ